MTEPPRAPRVLQPLAPEQQALASERRRLHELDGKKLEDALEEEAKAMLALTCEKMSERTARFKAIAMFLAIKHRLGPMFGEARDEETGT